MDLKYACVPWKRMDTHGHAGIDTDADTRTPMDVDMNMDTDRQMGRLRAASLESVMRSGTSRMSR